MIFTSSFSQKSFRHNRLLHQECSRLEGSRLEGSTASQTLCPRAAPPIKEAAAAVMISIDGTNKNNIKIFLSTNPAAPANIKYFSPCGPAASYMSSTSWITIREPVISITTPPFPEGRTLFFFEKCRDNNSDKQISKESSHKNHLLPIEHTLFRHHPRKHDRSKSG